jgi:hypothetical protein
MATLHIDLQEGFAGEEVRVAIDGEERLCQEARTKRVLALASRHAFEAADGPHVVEIAIPSRGIEKRIEVDALGDVHIGIGLGDELRVRIRDSRFGYG